MNTIISKGLFMKTQRTMLMAVFLVISLGAGITGCDFGVNPFLFDGTPVGADYRIDVTGTSYAGSSSIPLRDLLESIKKDVDSITVVNITLLIDSTAGTASSLSITGSSSVDSYTILTMTGVPISAFASERSIFDKTIPGLSFDRTGVDHIVSLLRNPESVPETVVAAVSGFASSSPMHFTLHVKIYTQVFAKSK